MGRLADGWTERQSERLTDRWTDKQTEREDRPVDHYTFGQKF